ncbi:MAG: NERD domain-containing protein [Fibromonadales bacterium]|nr:NERD domain-containing protein [Fibromonadales bacterium]
MLGLFEEKMAEPVILKENSSLDEQLKQLTEFSQKPLPADIREQVEQEIRRIKTGIAGENKLLFELKNSHIPMFVLRDLCIEEEDLSAQIDFFVITKKLLFVIECKSLYGNIEIDSKGDFIRTMHFGKYFKKERIYSPITQNERHMELIRQVRQKDKKNFLTKMIFQNYAFQKFYRSLVVLANEQSVLNAKYAPKEIREKVIHADHLIGYIKKENAALNEWNSSEDEMWQFAKFFMDAHHNRKIDYTHKYLNKIAADKADESTISESPTEINLPSSSLSEEKIVCSKCGAPMVKRTVSKKGKDVGKEFWGCSKFPSCRNTLGFS